MKILLIEDNLTIIKALKYNLELNNYEVDYVTSFSEALTYLNNNLPELIILDVSSPDGDGFSLYENYISKKNVSTIFLTAKDDEDDIVKGLELGADEYITKPFSMKELQVRINRILKKNKKDSVIKIGDIIYDYEKMEVYKNNQKIILSSIELKLVDLLFNNINKVVKRSTILDKIWEWTGNDVDDHTITVYFKRIREKLGTNIIVTVKGIGYRIDYEK